MIEKLSGFTSVNAKLRAACVSAGRTPENVELVAVSKTFLAEDIVPVLDAGQRVFGENRVQEAAKKWPELRKCYEGIDLHLIGPLQTNKTSQAVGLFDCIETLDRPKLARTLANEMTKQQKQLKLFIQVNTGFEKQKAGVLPIEFEGFLKYCQTDLGLSIYGLMCIPPQNEQPENHFRLLAEMAQNSGLRGLSMGMSADYEIAVECGATHVRVGSAIFGTR